ncbi:MAG: 3-deoxy-manno-octulosonate cytidylyltransferase [Pseudomonadales bacterium]|nr:3-deoxy-manno-octulosonate cytidylyltransferase [Pseudomonadales bacterium]
MKFHVVIPARFASQRLPGKPLADIAGYPMIVRVAQQAQKSSAASVVVATDDQRIIEAVAAAGLNAVLTRDDHASGSDRVMEVAQRLGWADDDILVNVQGDEPLIPVSVIEQVARLLQRQPDLACATLCESFTDSGLLFNPNVVKVVRDAGHRALYFSRAPIPWRRLDFADVLRAGNPTRAVGTPLEPGIWLRHIGVYAFRIAALRRFVSLPAGTLETLESLEQLRMLEAGMAIGVEEAEEPVPGGVDTPEDLARVRGRFVSS